jgi:hypothetical protein
VTDRTELAKAERPNTIAGLQQKRAQLVAVRRQLEVDLRKVTCDIDHLDATIRLFDAEATPAAIRRYATKHRAKKGHVTRFVLERLRAASGLTTSREITEAWLEARKLRTDDATFVIIRKRIGACLIKLVASGVAEAVDTGSLYRGYRLTGF